MHEFGREGRGGWGVGGWSVECGGESVEGKREHRRVYTHSTLSSLCPAGKVSLASGSAGLSQVACPPSLHVLRNNAAVLLQEITTSQRVIQHTSWGAPERRYTHKSLEDASSLVMDSSGTQV